MSMEILSLLQLVLTVICLMTGGIASDCNAQLVDCLESDREALIEFKSVLNDPENRLLSWKGSNCCQWHGIICDNHSGAVITVDLHNPHPSILDPSGGYGFWNLSGEISPSLTKLKFLRHLDLSFNSFNHIQIPDFLDSMEKLQYLNLSNAGFSGAIPPTLGNISSLQYLDLDSSSSFPVLTAHNLDWVTGLTSLKHLKMRAVNLSKVSSEWIVALNKLQFLTELDLSDCGLSGSIASLSYLNFTSLTVMDLSGNLFISHLPSWFVNISRLVSLDISFSGLYGRIPLGFGELPNFQIFRLSSNDNLTASCSQLFRGSWERIEVIDLFLNKLHGKLPASFGNMTSLTHFDLFANGVEGGIPSSIGRLCNLQYIDLSANNLTGSLPEFLEGTENCLSGSTLPSLQHLDWSNNHLVGILPKWLGQLSNLGILNLLYNSLEGPIPDTLGSLGNLTELRLGGNRLNGTLPASLGQLSELTVFDVSINNLWGVVSEKHFSKLSKLEILILSANSFILNVTLDWFPPFQVWFLDMGSCHLGPQFPAWLMTQKKLNFLDFSNASISGTIPDWFWDIAVNLSLLNVSYNDLKGRLPNPLNVSLSANVDMSSNSFEGPVPIPTVSLGALVLANNQFSGLIPEEVGKIMPNLIFFSLSGNQLTGSIPVSIGEMSVLEVLDLSYNNLTGSILPEIGICLNLKVIDLQSNSLSGVIPEQLGQLNLLQTLHLSNNKLSGELPSALLNLSSLETLDLGNNRLRGHIAPWIGGGFTKLRILSLRSNAFYGELPSSLSNLSSLQVVDLAENELNGTIPASFGDFKAMTREENINSIDLSANNLHGELPEEMTKLAGLLVLNLSRNQISGQIPQSISELHQLSSLDLSNNRLSGAIPSSMSSLSYLGSLNLSNNNLSGEIPYAGHMTTYEASSFGGNLGLCGSPLGVKCPGDDSYHGETAKDDGNDDDTVDKWFYLSIGLGFAAGILVPYFVLVIKRPWSNAYFNLVDKIADRIAYWRLRYTSY
ncbi:receptor-like protein EIX2 isoform X2 [Tripterygium wilfordii]|uniref:receptor-like protein EIX2 isoform X2 n=1 Tax=Tripterygium wilfordii TaxID=458696 RepID=UPI0018F81325|nr:receptor-like protein EIX2 isoform X2 [Tripterygium wilfordii]